MAGARWLLGGGADPDIVRKLAGDCFEHRHAGGVIAVVVGEEDAHHISFFPVCAELVEAPSFSSTLKERTALRQAQAERIRGSGGYSRPYRPAAPSNYRRRLRPAVSFRGSPPAFARPARTSHGEGKRWTGSGT